MVCDITLHFCVVLSVINYRIMFVEMMKYVQIVIYVNVNCGILKLSSI